MIEVNLSDTVYLACRARLFSTLLLLVYASMAQANTLGITSAVMNADGTAVLAVPSTVSGAAPAGLEWTIVYSPNQISSMVITPGPATAGASKTLSCVSSSGGATCIVAGLNRNPIGSGVVAYLNTTVVQGQTSASIQISNLYATDPDGNGSIVTSAGGGQITSYGLLPVTCSPTHLTPGGVSNCTVSLTQAAPAGGATVTLASNNTSVTVPASITLAAGAATANFSATALTTFTGNQSATVTATLGSSSQTVIIGSAGGTPVFIQEKDNQVTSGLSASTTLSSSTTAGNLIAVFVIWDNTSNASISDTLGNTYPAAVAPTRWNSTRSIQTFYAINRAGGSDTVTATFGGAISSFGIIYAHEYSGVRTTSPIDVTAAAAGLSRSLDSGSALTTNNTDLLFAGGVSANVVTAAGSGYTARSTFQGNITEDQIVLTTGSYNATATQSTGAWATQMVAFKGASDTSPPTVPIGLSVTGVSTSTVSLSWVASTDPDDASNQLSYAVYRNGSLLGITTPGVTSFNDSGLAAAVTYTYTISASDPAGNASTQSAGISATTNSLAPVLVTGVACNPGSVISGASATCVITLSRIVSADTLISLTSSSVLLSIPASIKVSAGNQIGSAILTAGIVPKNIQAVVSAALGTSLQSTTVLLWPTPTLSSLACSPTKIPVGSTSHCVVALSNPGGNLSIAISSSSPALIALANLNVPAGSPSVDFSVMAQAASAHSILLKASDNGGSVSQSLLLVPANQTQSTGAAQIRSISCGSGSVSKICRVTVTDPTGAAHLQLSLSSSNQSIRLPDALTLEPGQTSTRFRVDAISPVKSTEGIITAQLGMNAIQHSVSFDSQSGPIGAPAHTYVRYGERIRFRVSPSESGSTLSASGVPAGAYFDSMIFQWTPDFNARGTHSVVFTEVHPDGSSLTTTSIIEVDSGKPVVARVVNAASRSEAVCSPRAIVSLEGRWLLQGQDESDMSGNSTELSGTVVRVNGVAAPILSATTSRVDFLCPVAVPGSLLEIVLQTSTDVAQAIYIVSREATPGIFSLDGSGGGQGVIMHSGTATMVMIPNYQYPSRGALPEELVAIYATGIGEAHKVSVIAGGVELPAQSPVAIPDLPGLYQITVRLPAALDDGKESISLNIQMLGGSSLRSNEVWVATEAGQQ